MPVMTISYSSGGAAFLGAVWASAGCANPMNNESETSGMIRIHLPPRFAISAGDKMGPAGERQMNDDA